MSKPILKGEALLVVVLGLVVLTGWFSSAESVITIKSAEVVNGVAVVKGGNAARSAPISWEGALVTQANNGGNFSFQGAVPPDCVGRLEDGVPADAVDVALANCGPVSDTVAPVPQTGQTTSYAEGDDGDIEAGVAWPDPRFTDNGDGTVTDHLTGLIWLKDMPCFGGLFQWDDAVQVARGLASGQCGLSDGSVAGDWRLPDVRELQSLLDFGRVGPALPAGQPFTGQHDLCSWSSTTLQGAPSREWSVCVNVGSTIVIDKISQQRTWPVRGPE